MFSRNIIAILLLAYLINLAVGGSYRPSKFKRGPGGLTSNVRSTRPRPGRPTGKRNEIQKGKNEYEVIHEAINSRRASVSNSRPISVRSKPHSKIRSPFKARSSKGENTFGSSYGSGAHVPKLLRDRKFKSAKSYSWKKTPQKTSGRRSIAKNGDLLKNDDEAEYSF